MLISGSCLRPDRDGAALLRGAAPHRRDLFRALEPPRIAARNEARTAETPRGKGDRACGSRTNQHLADELLRGRVIGLEVAERDAITDLMPCRPQQFAEIGRHSCPKGLAIASQRGVPSTIPLSVARRRSSRLSHLCGNGSISGSRSWMICETLSPSITSKLNNS